MNASDFREIVAWFGKYGARNRTEEAVLWSAQRIVELEARLENLERLHLAVAMFADDIEFMGYFGGGDE